MRPEARTAVSVDGRVVVQGAGETERCVLEVIPVADVFDDTSMQLLLTQAFPFFSPCFLFAYEAASRTAASPLPPPPPPCHAHLSDTWHGPHTNTTYAQATNTKPA
jgi:hypothetical protein